jgi:integrase
MSNSLTFTPYLKKKFSGDKEGIINIRITENRKSKYFSIKEKLKEKDWNPKKNEVRNSCKDYDRLTIIIKEKIEELKLIHQQVSTVEKVKDKENLFSVLVFYKNEVDLLLQQRKFGTSKKMNTTLTHFNNFLISKGLSDIKFQDISIDLVEKYEIYLLSKGLSRNTSKKYVSIFGKIYNLGLKKQIFIPKSNPFILFQNTRVPVEKKRLSKIEVETIINRNIEPKNPLFKIKNYFLFQIFCQGIRVSDLLTLRWSNLVSGRIEFFQYKTKKKHSVLINDNLVFILKDFMNEDCSVILNQSHSFKMEKSYSMNFFEIKSKFDEIKKEHRTSFVQGNKTSIEIIEKWKNILDDIRFKVVGNLLIKITEYSKSNKNKFIVELLNDDDFKDVVFDGNPFLTQFQFNQISSKTTIYNKQLKELQFLCKIKTSLTSHITRHTYTNLLIENTDNDIYSISKSLGHQRLSTTEHYLSDFNTIRTDKVNQEMNNLFFM